MSPDMSELSPYIVFPGGPLLYVHGEEDEFSIRIDGLDSPLVTYTVPTGSMERTFLLDTPFSEDTLSSDDEDVLPLRTFGHYAEDLAEEPELRMNFMRGVHSSLMPEGYYILSGSKKGDEEARAGFGPPIKKLLYFSDEETAGEIRVYQKR